MKKSILALAALLGTGAMGWAQNTTTTGTSGSTTTNSSTTTNTVSPSTNTSTNTNSSTNTSVNGNAPTTDNMSGTPANTNTGTNSMVNPGNSNTTGTLQSSTTTGVDGMQNQQGSMQSSSNYPAYGAATAVPGNLSTSLQRDYPTAFNPSWQQAGDWYRASFNNQNRNVMVYYAPNGNSYSVALPVLNGYIPEEVVTKALNTYGSNLYSISRVKAANGQDAYQINTLDGGMARNEFIGEDGSSFAAIDVFRHDEDNMANGELQTSSSNAANSDVNTSTGMDSTMKAAPATGDTTSGTGVNSSMSTGTGTDMSSANTSTDSSSTDMNSTNSTNSAEPKYKHKVKTEDGKKLKIKTKNGETKVKGDALDANGGQ